MLYMPVSLIFTYYMRGGRGGGDLQGEGVLKGGI